MVEKINEMEFSQLEPLLTKVHLDSREWAFAVMIALFVVWSGWPCRSLKRRCNDLDSASGTTIHIKDKPSRT
jgi:hypothetical protein